MSEKKADEANRVSRFSWLKGMVPLLALAHFAHHLLTALPAPMLPMIRSDFSLDYTGAGLVVSAFSLAYGIGQLPAGWLTDRVGARIVIIIGICGVSAFGFLIGLAPDYLTLLFLMALAGLAGGFYHPAAPPLISASVKKTQLGRALGLHAIGGSASFFLAPIAAAAIATVWGWRGAFMTLAVPATILGIVLYFALARVSVPVNKIDIASGTAVAEKPGKLTRITFFIILTVGMQSVLASILTFIPLFAVERFGVSKETAAIFLSLNYSSGLWAAPLGGYLSDRIGSVRAVLGTCWLAGLAVYFLNVIPELFTFGIIMIIMGMIIYIRMPASEAFIVNETNQRNRSTILGIYFFGNSEASALLTPVVGLLIDRFGFQPTFTAGAAFILILTLVCSFWLRDKSTR